MSALILEVRRASCGIMALTLMLQSKDAQRMSRMSGLSLEVAVLIREEIVDYEGLKLREDTCIHEFFMMGFTCVWGRNSKRIFPEYVFPIPDDFLPYFLHLDTA